MLVQTRIETFDKSAAQNATGISCHPESFDFAQDWLREGSLAK